MDLYEKPNRRRPDQVEALIRRADLVVSMRLHGLVLGLKHGRPVISVDPVAGGAKVAAQARALGWPLVLPGEAITPAALDAALDRCVSGELLGAVTAAKDVGSAGNERAREWLTQRLRS
jgi:polysaccharide pyruvyl transferase WcaK-like protein